MLGLSQCQEFKFIEVLRLLFHSQATKSCVYFISRDLSKYCDYFFTLFIAREPIPIVLSDCYTHSTQFIIVCEACL